MREAAVPATNTSLDQSYIASCETQRAPGVSRFRQFALRTSMTKSYLLVKEYRHILDLAERAHGQGDIGDAELAVLFSEFARAHPDHSVQYKGAAALYQSQFSDSVRALMDAGVSLVKVELVNESETQNEGFKVQVYVEYDRQVFVLPDEAAGGLGLLAQAAIISFEMSRFAAQLVH